MSITWWRYVNVVFAIFLFILHLLRFAIVVGYVVSNFADPTDYFQYDFGAYYVAAAVLNSEKPVLYNDQTASEVAATLNVQTRHSRYIYPPFFAVMLRPLTNFPHMSAISIWLVLNFLFFALVVRQLLLMSSVSFKWPVYIALLLIVSLVPSVSANLFVFGQINLFMLWLILLTHNNS